MDHVREETQRIPATLWTALQDICWAQDVKFIQDVSRIIGKDASDVKRRVLGVRGEPNIVLVDKDPWWIGSQCSIMELGPGAIWRRCNKMGESNSYCWDHRHFVRSTYRLRHNADPHFNGLLRRYPVRFMDELVWVCEKGTVLRGSGELMDVTIDLKAGVAKGLRPFVPLGEERTTGESS